MSRPAKPPEERLQSNIRKTESGCWEWIGSFDRLGYGKISVPSRGSQKAHRFAYETFVGPIPTGLLVLHTCDNRGCVNPKHLYLGTHADNARDATVRGRWVGPRKLTDAQVAEILALLKTSMSQQQIADKVGTTQLTVSHVKRGTLQYVRAFLNRSKED